MALCIQHDCVYLAKDLAQKFAWNSSNRVLFIEISGGTLWDPGVEVSTAGTAQNEHSFLKTQMFWELLQVRIMKITKHKLYISPL